MSTSVTICPQTLWPACWIHVRNHHHPSLKQLFDEGKLNEAQVTFETKPPEELYDLENDPDEVSNLAKSKDHAEILKKMRWAHLNHLKTIIDVGFLPEGEIHEGPREPPYEMARSGKYPFQRIMLAADMASGLSPWATKPLIGYLKDKDSPSVIGELWGF